MEDRVQVQRMPGDLGSPGPPVHLGDPSLVAAEQLGREVAQRADDSGPDDLDLPEQIRPAGVDLLRPWVAIAGRAALEDVGDEDQLARHADGFEQLLEQLAGLADERSALLVLVVARGLSDEHEVGARIALAEHRTRASVRERAPGTALDLVAEGIECGECGVSDRWHRTRRRRWSSSWTLPCRQDRMTMNGRRTWTATGRRRAERHSGHSGLLPLRTSSSNAVPHCLQQNS